MAKYLIVDDDPAGRRLMNYFLSPYGECEEATDGPGAIQAFRQALEQGVPYNLICLDIMMPGADGHDVLRAIRQIEADHGIFGSDGTKVIMVTALSDAKHCIQAFGEGCESYITKPIRQHRLLAEMNALLGALPGRPATSGSPHRDGARFLIVDDDRLCRELLKDMLSPYGKCDFAYDGQEGIDAIRLALEEGRPYELVCLDIMMPGTNGHQALEAIRKIEMEYGIYGTDGVKVVMTTALRESQHCVQAFHEGCEAYLTKPIRHDELLKRIRDLGVIIELQPTAEPGA
jgi:two-component system, chemotaxis family, chemotaxis protein CheY